MKSKVFALVTALVMCVGLQAQGLLDAFSKTGPGRPPALEDTVAPDGFVMIFGEEPPPFGVGGKRVNLSDMAKSVQWRQYRTQFKQLADVEVDAERVVNVMTESGSVPIAWESVTGTKYVAVIGKVAKLTHMPLSTFLALPIPKLGQTIAHQLIMRGECMDPIPPTYNSIYQDRNTENCKEK